MHQRKAHRFDESEEAYLLTLAAQLSSHLAEYEAGGEISDLLAPNRSTKNTILTGIASVSGVGIGHVVAVFPQADLNAVPERRADDVDEEIALFVKALIAVRKDMALFGEKLAPNLSAKELELFNAYLQMLDPESLGNDVIQEIKNGYWSQTALRNVVKRYIDQFETMDNDYMRERISDIKDISQRVLAYLQAESREKVTYPKKVILLGEEINATHLAEVPKEALVGIVSGSGSSNSHVAIVARALGVPTVMGVDELPINRLNGLPAIVDGYYGQVYVEPSVGLAQEFQRLADEEQQLDNELKALLHLPAETQDKHQITLAVNTGLASDISLSLSVGAEGIGLYRTEIPFMARERFPSEEEQRIVYRQLLTAFSPRSVTMRTLDIGGDKPLSYFPIEDRNPFLGWRGIRVSLDHPDIFLVQVRAMLKANKGLNNLRIMFPMISDVAEIDEAMQLVKKAYKDVLAEDDGLILPPIGAMIEVPSIVYQIQNVVKRVDFVSVGVMI